MRKISVFLLFVVAVLLLSGAAAFADSYGVVLPDNPSRTTEHAANELVKYLSEMTHAYVTMGEKASDADTVFLLDPAGSNAAVKTLKTSEPKEWAAEQSTDAYYLKSIKVKSRNYIVLAGKSDVSVLYAAYEYLERYGNCGFFEDGDHVPSKAPKVTGIDYFTSPRFSFRHLRGDVCGGWGLKKFHYFHWKEDDWMRFYDWMAKRRLNITETWPMARCLQAGDATEMTFGIKDDEPRELYGAGWPNTFSWPSKERTHILQHRLAYHRLLGMKTLYMVGYGLTPPPFKKLHPEYKWVPSEYEHAQIHPSDPASYDYTKRLLENVIALYGTDHLYYDTPYAESAGGENDYDKALDLKIAAAETDCKIFKEIDPDPVWVSDSWDLRTIPALWTKERKQRYYDSLPRDMMLVLDATTDFELHIEENDHYYGLPWTVGVLHSFQGDDHLHGNLQDLINRIQEAANDPKSDKLMGYAQLPEIHGANTLYWHLSTELAWNPKGVKLEDFLRSYTLQRYGEDSFDTMLKAQQAVVDGVYRGNGRIPIYKKMGLAVAYNPEIWDDSYTNGVAVAPSVAKTVHSLRKGIELALTQENLQNSNPLYENDLVEWTKSYLGHLVNYYTVRSYQAFKAGDVQELERCKKAALTSMDQIENILSTRPDYYLKNTIDQAMSVPGTNPYTPKMIRQNCINWLYATNDCYEQMHFYYRPKVDVYFNGLSKKIGAENRTLGWGDVFDDYGKIDKKWLDGPIDVPESEHFKGTPIQAVQAALKETQEFASACGTESGWRTSKALSIECGVKPEGECLTVVSAVDGEGKTTEKNGSKCWTFGTESASKQPYLFFSINDLYAYECKSPATITVEYLDEGKGDVALEYDSTDSKAPYGGAVKPVHAFSLAGTGAWRTAEIRVPDARFGDHLNSGSDFRFCGNGAVLIRKVTVSRK